MLTSDESLALCAAAKTAAEQAGTPPMSFAVTDPGGHLVALVRMDGALWITATVAQGKAWTSAAYGAPSHAQKEKVAQMPNFASALTTMTGGVVHPADRRGAGLPGRRAARRDRRQRRHRGPGPGRRHRRGRVDRLHDHPLVGALNGRVALVTGASRPVGIGAAVVRRLVADGAAVLAHSWVPYDEGQPWGGDPAAPQALVEELRAAGGRVEHVSADLADPQAPARLVARAREAFGGLDVLVANHARSTLQGLADLTADEVDLTYAVNVRATLLLVQALDRGRAPAPGGRVVLFTSGRHAGAMPGELPYVASKGALHRLTASLAIPLVARGTTVNCIDPGRTTPGTPTTPCATPSRPSTRPRGGDGPRTGRGWWPGWCRTRRTGSPAR